MDVSQALSRLNLIVKSGGPQAIAAQEILDQRAEGGFVNDDAFIAAVEGLPARFSGDAAVGLNSRVAIFRRSAVSSTGSLSPEKVAFVDYAVEAVNLSFENPGEFRGHYVTGLADRVRGFV